LYEIIPKRSEVFTPRVQTLLCNLWLGFLVNPRTIIILTHFQNGVFIGEIESIRDFRGGKKSFAAGVYRVVLNHGAALRNSIGPPSKSNRPFRDGHHSFRQNSGRSCFHKRRKIAMNTRSAMIATHDLQIDASRLIAHSPAAWAKAAFRVTAVAAATFVIGVGLTHPGMRPLVAAQPLLHLQQPLEDISPVDTSALLAP
jgi:hypothetical protein